LRVFEPIGRPRSTSIPQHRIIIAQDARDFCLPWIS
jgi:hypothetical protein